MSHQTLFLIVPGCRNATACIFSVSVLSGIIFGRNDETPSFSCSPVHGLDDVNHLLLVLKWPVDFVVVSRAQVHHNVFVSEIGKPYDGIDQSFLRAAKQAGEWETN